VERSDPHRHTAVLMGIASLHPSKWIASLRSQ
jgi:hypothetical protein